MSASWRNQLTWRSKDIALKHETESEPHYYVKKFDFYSGDKKEVLSSRKMMIDLYSINTSVENGLMARSSSSKTSISEMRVWMKAWVVTKPTHICQPFVLKLCKGIVIISILQLRKRVQGEVEQPLKSPIWPALKSVLHSSDYSPSQIKEPRGALRSWRGTWWVVWYMMKRHLVSAWI